MRTYDFHTLIGIDPDLEKSGVAVSHEEHYSLGLMSFWELYDFLKAQNRSTLVYLEAGWLNKGIYHHHPKQSQKVRERIAKDVGMNHGCGILIEEMLKYLKIPYKLIRPTSSKIETQKKFNQITGWTGRSNQEQRDAMMLIYGLRTKKYGK